MKKNKLIDFFDKSQIECSDCGGLWTAEHDGSYYVIVSKEDVSPIDLLKFIQLGFGVVVHDYEFDLEGQDNIYKDCWVITEDPKILIVDK